MGTCCTRNGDDLTRSFAGRWRWKKFLNGIFSATAARIATVLSLQCVPLPSLFSAPVHWGPSATLWGLGPPTQNLHFWTVTFFKIPLNWDVSQIARGVRGLTTVKFSRGVTGQNLEKSGFEFLGVFNKGTCDATYRKIVVPSFSDGQTMINAVGMVSKSTSGPEL